MAVETYMNNWPQIGLSTFKSQRDICGTYFKSNFTEETDMHFDIRLGVCFRITFDANHNIMAS